MSTVKTLRRQIGREYCDTCGIDPEFYMNQIYSLTEKLEFSTMQILKLSGECDRLRKELCEAEFIGRSSVPRRPPPSLPNELLREIFSLATHLESDLVAPYWELERPYVPWVISSQARRNIPLVCRQWHLAGLEYLYEHIIIYTPSQLSKLLDVFKGLEPDAQLQAKYMGWIRGLEFIVLRHDVDSEKEFTREACDLIYRLPRGRLRVFGFEDRQRQYYLHYHGRDCSNILEIMRAGIIASQKSSEALYFPVLSFKPHSVEDGPSPDLEDPVLDVNTGTMESIDLHKLEILSLVNGGWDEDGRTPEDAFFFASHVHSIRTIYLRSSQRSSYIHLRAATRLETIHIFDDLIGSTAVYFDQFLEAVPRLRRLVINLNYQYEHSSKIVTNDAVIHTSLEEISLIMNSIWGYKSINAIYSIFSKIQTGCLPKLRRVVVCGPYPNGWLDAAVHEAQYARDWKLAIKACEKRGVDLVDKKGNAIHLWHTQSGSKVQPESEAIDSDTASSSEGKWWEVSTSGYNESVGTDDDIVSEDSEDGPYRYVSQPDLDYDHSSESSES